MKVFLIAPYNIDPDYNRKKHLIAELLKKVDCELVVAEDKLKNVSLSAEATLKLFQKCDFFIADLSFERPSCYYELGYLQALGKRIAVIAQSGSQIHQLQSKDNISYYNDLTTYKEIIEKIIKII